MADRGYSLDRKSDDLGAAPYSERRVTETLQADWQAFLEQALAFRRLGDVSQITGFWHDLGKSGTAFQAMVKRSGNAKALRILDNLSDDALEISLRAITSAAENLEVSAIERAKTVALLSAGRERIDRIQAETRTALDHLLGSR